MKYTEDLWYERIWARSDISTYLTHLTRETDDLKPYEVLLKILNEKTIVGSTNNGFVKGNYSAVCFQDAPVQGIAQNIRHEFLNMEKLGGKVRYRAAGLMFSKPYAFRKGARPVIYDTKTYGDNLSDEEKYRAVTLDLNNPEHFIDWTHEREWRVKGNFEFDYRETTVLLPDVEAYRDFIKNVSDEILENIAGIVTLNTVIS